MKPLPQTLTSPDFAKTGMQGIPDPKALMRKAVEDDPGTKNRFVFLNNRPGSLGAAFNEKAAWSVKMANFRNEDTINLIDDSKGEKIEQRAKVFGLKQETIRKTGSVKRGQENVYEQIVDKSNKIVDADKVFNNEFAADIEKNRAHLYNTLTGLRSRRSTTTEKPRPLKNFKNFYVQQQATLTQWQSRIDKIKEQKTLKLLQQKNNSALSQIQKQEKLDEKRQIKCEHEYGQNPFEGKTPKISSTFHPKNVVYKTGYSDLKYQYSQRYNYEQKYQNHSQLHNSFIYEKMGFKSVTNKTTQNFYRTIGQKDIEYDMSQLLSPETRSQTVNKERPQNFRKEEAFDARTNSFIDEIRWKAKTPNNLLPSKKPLDEDYNFETKMFKKGDSFKNFLQNQQSDTCRQKTPLRSPEPKIGQNVRISNNPNDTNIDIIIEKLMRNRAFHKDFDPIMSREKVRYYIRDLVFQDSCLEAYNPYVDREKQRITETEFNQPELKSQKANFKDMQRALWINYELHKKPYQGFQQADDSDEEMLKEEVQEDQIELDPEYIKAKKWEEERQKDYDLFLQKIHQVFDPLSFICKETSLLSEQKKDRVSKIQQEYYDRLMKKDSNNSVYGWPDYLCRFKSFDANLPKILAKEVLTDTFDLEAENRMLDNFLVQKHKWEHCGGPLTLEVLEQYPGVKEYVKHLRERFGLKYRVYKPPPKDIERSSQSKLQLYQEKRRSSMGFKSEIEIEKNFEIQPGTASEKDPIYISFKEEEEQKEADEKQIVETLVTSENLVTSDLQQTSTTRKENKIKQLLEQNAQENIFPQVIMDQWLTQKSRRKERRLEEKAVIDRLNNKESDEEDMESDEEYLEALLEHRFEEYQNSQQIKDDIYKKDEVKNILHNNWIRFVVTSRQKKEDFDITLKNFRLLDRRKTLQDPKIKNIFTETYNSFPTDSSTRKKKAIVPPKIPKNLNPTLKIAQRDSYFPCSKGHDEQHYDSISPSKPKQILSKLEILMKQLENGCEDLTLVKQKTTLTMLGRAKQIANELELFLQRIDQVKGNVAQNEFQAVSNTYKETKKVKKGIEEYISIMSINPTKADQEMTVLDYIEDYILAKQQYKENIKNKDNIERIKQENSEMSTRIAAFGNRQPLWQPSKMSIQITKDQSRQKRKAALIRFDNDGRVIPE